MNNLEGKKVLIAEPIFFSDKTFSWFTDEGCELIVGPDVTNKKDGYSEEQLIELAKECDAIVGMSREKITRNVFEADGSKLRIVCKYGIGVDHIDVDAATENNVLVSNSPVINETVAEFTIALILGLYKKIPFNDNFVRKGNWRSEPTIGIDLKHKIIGFLGFGSIARSVMQRLQGWDMKFIAYDPYLTPEMIKGMDVELVDWDTLFKESDIVSLHLPLTDETLKSVSDKEFDMMKDSAIIVNTARGKIIDHNALVNAIRNKKIWGAGLDVFEQEPLNKDDELLLFENVIVAGHTAGWTNESLSRMAEQAAKNVIQALKGELPEYIINKEITPQWLEKYGDK